MKSSGILPPHQAVQLQPRRPGDLIRSTRTNWEAHWIAASLITLGLALATACEAENHVDCPLEAQPNKSLKN